MAGQDMWAALEVGNERQLTANKETGMWVLRQNEHRNMSSSKASRKEYSLPDTLLLSQNKLWSDNWPPELQHNLFVLFKPQGLW
jgi:hypothetical protein